ncbi:MAG: hypothetical protein J7J31_07505 [Helicobacteraceae bacterium]|nr:hypothetical protein [Helicobacteraceae bacterium]
MEIGSTSSYLPYSFNNYSSFDENSPRSRTSQVKQADQETDKMKYQSEILDEKASNILDALLEDKLQSEKQAIKVMLEQTLSPDGKALNKEALLQKLDEYINSKKNGIMLNSASLFHLASSLKTLYESDFKPLDLSA